MPSPVQFQRPRRVTIAAWTTRSRQCYSATSVSLRNWPVSLLPLGTRTGSPLRGSPASIARAGGFGHFHILPRKGLCLCDAGVTRHLLFLIQTLCNELIASDRGRAFRCGSGPFETGIPRALTRDPPRSLRGSLTSPEPAGPRYIVMGGALNRLSLGPPPCSARLHYSHPVRVRVDPGAQPSRPCPYTIRSQPVSSRRRTYWARIAWGTRYTGRWHVTSTFHQVSLAYAPRRMADIGDSNPPNRTVYTARYRSIR